MREILFYIAYWILFFLWMTACMIHFELSNDYNTIIFIHLVVFFCFIIVASFKEK